MTSQMGFKNVRDFPIQALKVEYSDSWKEKPPSTVTVSDWCRNVQWKAVHSSKVTITNKKGFKEDYGLTLAGEINEITTLFSRTINIYRKLESLGDGHERADELKKIVIDQIQIFGNAIGKKRSVDYFTKIQAAYNNQLIKLNEATDKIISVNPFMNKEGVDKHFDHDFFAKIKEIEELMEKKLTNPNSYKHLYGAKIAEEKVADVESAEFFLPGYDTE